jgi:hypothetical protein
MNTTYHNLAFDGNFGNALDQLCRAQSVANYKLVSTFYVPTTNSVVLIFQK